MRFSLLFVLLVGNLIIWFLYGKLGHAIKNGWTGKMMYDVTIIRAFICLIVTLIYLNPVFILIAMWLWVVSRKLDDKESGKWKVLLEIVGVLLRSLGLIVISIKDGGDIKVSIPNLVSAFGVIMRIKG